MPASIVLSDLSWSTPDGRQLFEHLDLALGAERVGLVGRNGVGKTTLLRLVAGELTPQSGSVGVQGRLGVLRQLLQVDDRETLADLFGVREALAVLARAEAGAADEHDLAVADWTLETRIAAALAHLDLEASLDTPLTSLSGGQRTRAALAALLIAEPDILVLDEPTNHLDRAGRQAVVDFLAQWRGGALVVSHDRELLEGMDAIVELTSLRATRYGGGWSAYRLQKDRDLQAARHDLADAEKRFSELARTTQASAERKARRDGAGARKAAKGDQPRILLGLMKDRAEDSGGEAARLAERRRADAEASLAAARAKIEVLAPLTIDLPTTSLPPQREVLRFEAVSFAYPGAPPLLHDLDLAIVGPERIAVTGSNGSGKTTLLHLAAGLLQPTSGVVRRLAPAVLLDQQASLLDLAVSIRDNFRRLHPALDENACRAALARFMFRADAALQTVGSLSGGQRLRAALACVLGGPAPPPLIVLDEPTNHLDLDSIAEVEAGLSAFDGALLVISHDEAFLQAIGVTRRLALPPSASNS